MASAWRLRNALAVLVIVCGLLHVGPGFISSGGKGFLSAPQVGPQRPPSARVDAVSVGASRGPRYGSASAQASWRQLGCFAIFLGFAARAGLSRNRNAQNVEGAVRTRARVSVVCSAAQSYSTPPPPPSASPVQPRQLVEEVEALSEPLISLHSQATALPAAALPHCSPSAQPRPTRASRAAWIGGARRSRTRAARSAHQAASASCAERTNHKHVGARLQNAGPIEVAPPSYDASRIPSRIQMGLQVVASTSAAHGREHRSPKQSASSGVKTTGVRVQSCCLDSKRRSRQIDARDENFSGCSVILVAAGFATACFQCRHAAQEEVDRCEDHSEPAWEWSLTAAAVGVSVPAYAARSPDKQCTL